MLAPVFFLINVNIFFYGTAKKTKNVVETIFPFLPHPLRPIAPEGRGQHSNTVFHPPGEKKATTIFLSEAGKRVFLRCPNKTFGVIVFLRLRRQRTPAVEFEKNTTQPCSTRQVKIRFPRPIGLFECSKLGPCFRERYPRLAKFF